LDNLKKLVASSGIVLEFSDYALEYMAEQVLTHSLAQGH
jgi:hypothetical protein